MVYRRSSTNIRKPRRRARSSRAPARRRVVRSTYRRTSRRTKPMPCQGEMSATSKFALAQLDPFEVRAFGAKVPDSNTMPSIANSDTDQVNLSSSAVTANNLIAIAFKPQYNQAYLVASDGPGTVTWSGNWTARRNLSNVISSIEAIRPVAHAIRVCSALAPTAATGFVHLGLSVESRRSHQAGVNPDLPRTVNDMTGLAHYKRVTVASLTQSPLTAINKWIDETGFRYEDPRALDLYQTDSTISTSTLNFGQSWATIVIMVEGQPVGITPLSFEHVLMTECIPRKEAFILGTGAAPNSPGTMSAVSTMSAEQDFTHTEAEQETYIASGVRAFANGAQTAGAQVYNNVALPLVERLGQYAGATAIQMAFNAAAGYGGLPGVNSNVGRLAL